jgi:hypothetical protein
MTEIQLCRMDSRPLGRHFPTSTKTLMVMLLRHDGMSLPAPPSNDHPVVSLAKSRIAGKFGVAGLERTK